MVKYKLDRFVIFDEMKCDVENSFFRKIIVVRAIATCTLNKLKHKERLQKDTMIKN